MMTLKDMFECFVGMMQALFIVVAVAGTSAFIIWLSFTIGNFVYNLLWAAQ